ncbi:MAG: TetR/AcrR family transcriptional regulator [Chloroflexota bacterium]|nr:TetR/AcrR family transcriptional regulator [Dehalococcoidia bacterium]MDW8046536.1 TetR/AcrR family transcriptional regulator [Chloroflexota bacterium]
MSTTRQARAHARSADSQPAPPPDLAPGTRIDEVIEAAERLFVRGYRRSSVRDLAAELGIRVSSLYYYFPSKDAILETIIRRHLEDIRDLARSVVARGTAGGWPYREILRTLIAESVLFLIRDRRAAEISATQTRELPEAVQEQLKPPLKEYEYTYIDVIRRGIEAGEFIETDPFMAAYIIFGAQVRLSAWYDPEGRLSPEEVARIYSTLLTRAIARNPDDPAFAPPQG